MLRRALRLGAQAVLPALVLFGAFLVTEALLSGPPRTMPGGARPEVVYSVTAADVALGANRATLRAFGELVAADAAELRVASPGEVVAVHPNLQIGRTVEAGAPLVTIDPFAYEGALREARAQLAEARAGAAEADARIGMETALKSRAEEQLIFAQTDLERAERLSRSGNITDKAMDDRRLLVSQRQQSLDQVRYTLEAEVARRDQQAAAVERLQWMVEKAERALEDTVLAAPFTGIVREENASVGRQLAANDLAVSLIRADALDVRFVLSDQRYGRLLDEEALFGTEVEVIWRIGDTPLTYNATVTRAGADIDSGRGGVDVFARVDLGNRAAPRPGAFVEVRIPGVVRQNTARVPTAALYGRSVFVIGPDDRLVSRKIIIHALDDGDAIVSGPLNDGDQVVTTRLAEAGDGIKVNRVDGPAKKSAAPDTASVATKVPDPNGEPPATPARPRKQGAPDAAERS
ncbi:efflux RND transporter periplasmic adaptor subunit [Acuticoccus sp. MNP-M23]|uniref:efflux RND transporter periplasmic adaptor subunit n=1 Tax=Acuticoccus sp. MNP-M23 TaxID=3072793 RepID=UPI0028165933|nr:efflux RND transporter periplasmic adaptor subunit [Acuticoccus sp. MNP-M23]WMS44219.1 efflux RND transporter periplasmic adaptor subunit [Acuticoccus sp. MNP-M23]